MNLSKLFNCTVQALPLVTAFTVAIYVTGGGFVHLGLFTLCALGAFSEELIRNTADSKSELLTQPSNKRQNRFNRLVQKKDLPIQFHIIENKAYADNAFCNTDRRIIAVGKNLVKQLTNDELDFVKAHELEHLHQETPYVSYYAKKITENAALFSGFAMFVGPLNDKLLDMKVAPVYIGAWILQSALTSRLYQELEFKCDAGAVERIGNDRGAISYFQNHDKGLGFYMASHPSADKRKHAIINKTFANPKQGFNSPSHDIA